MDSIQTVFDTQSLSKTEKQNKCNVYLRLKDTDDHVIIGLRALDGQNITVEFKNGEYYVEFSNLDFGSNGGTNIFIVSGRIITN